MPMEAQTRLLRVLQQGEYTTVGGRTPIKTDVRIIAATNKDLRILIQQGLFREDLFFRLNVVPLRLPPLRERIEDIPDLIRHFFALAEREGLPPKQIEHGRASSGSSATAGPATCASSKTSPAGSRRSIRRKPSPPRSSTPNSRSRRRRRSATRAAGRGEPVGRGRAPPHKYFGGFGDGLPPPGLYHRILREIEYPLLSAALAATRGNQIRAADLLGVNRNTLRKKIRDLDIQVIRTSS